MTTDEMIEVMARVIARGLGDEYANAFKNKERWVAKRGMSGGRFRDINEPFRSDYDNAARAALAAILPVLREEVAGERRDREVAGEWDDFNAGCNSALADIRTRFNEIAKEIDG